MKAEELRRILMALVAGVATMLTFFGVMLGDDMLLVAGLFNLIAYALWLYGQTLHKS